jgi:glucose-6-phosphate 1-dehydrogenase
MQPSTGYETLIYDCLTGDQTCSSAPTISRTAGGRCNRSSMPGSRTAGLQTYKAGEDGRRPPMRCWPAMAVPGTRSDE